MCMRTSDFEFDNQKRSDGYIYINEDKLEMEIMEIVGGKKNIELLDIPEDISREAYLNVADCGRRVLKWYPFEDEARVLEVGAGYGRLTEYLCARVKYVVAYEKKEERLRVIEARCNQYQNLTCLSGELKELIMYDKFDYIVVHDIFAIARKFFKDKNPNVAMLKFLKKYLCSTGKLLLITENRLGLKYFSGAVEDYSQQFFWGLRSFDEDERVRTFSKNELKEILVQAGFLNLNWYYLYPDIMNTLEVYSDEIQEKIAYGITYPDYESCADRYEFFDEKRMFYTLYREGIVSNFANAFFVECSIDQNAKKYVYSNLLSDYHIKRQGDKYICDNGSELPAGIHINIYLMSQIQRIVNCNLGDENPYISAIYDLFKEMKDHMMTKVYYLEDFYYDNGVVNPVNIQRENIYGLEYYRWRLGYLWYLENVMRYRNAKRRILLEDLLAVLNVDAKRMNEYIKIFLTGQKNRHILPRLAQNMFDFEAEAAKDVVFFDKQNLIRTTVQDELKVLHSGMAGE